MNYFHSLDKAVLNEIIRIGRLADRQNIKAFVVGGIVRDILLRRVNYDLDVVIEGDALEFARQLAERYKSELKIYPKFGTATWVRDGRLRIDITSARRETYAHPGALPAVSFGSLQDDIFRRDFTINAMALSLNKTDFGQLIDLCGARDDLRKGVIRVFHDESFRDDPTRILRAVRFEQRFGFSIESRTLMLLRQALEQDAVSTVKSQRYFAEFKKIWHENRPVDILARLQDLGGLFFLTPSLRFQRKALQNWHDAIGRLRQHRIYQSFKEWGVLYYFKLLETLDDEVVTQLLQKYPLNKEDTAALWGCRNTRRLLKYLKSAGRQPSEIFRALHDHPETVIIYARLKSLDENVWGAIDRYMEEWRYVTLKIAGEDITRMGIQSGERVGEVLRAVLYQKMDHGFTSKRQELTAARTLISKSS